MRFVESAAIRPHHCAVFPHLGATHERGYYDTGNDQAGFDNHIYISVVAVEELARGRGWKSPEELVDLQEAHDRLAERVAVLERELVEADRFANAIDVLESRDFRSRKKPGRPRKAGVGQESEQEGVAA